MNKFLGAILTVLFKVVLVISADLNVIPSLNITNIIPVNLINTQKTGLANEIKSNNIRLKYPNCPTNCEESWINDGWCDKECNIKECGNDGDDCVGWCAPECRPSWLGDGECDLDCFNPDCDWDKNDCKNEKFEIRKKIVLELRNKLINGGETTEKEFDYKYCPCNKELLGNNVCDAKCNSIECNMDGGDCLHRCNSRCINIWLEDGQCDPACDTKDCFFDKGDCKSCSNNCRTWKIGNGICDYECNNQECNFDGNDCANVCSVTKLDYDNQPFIYKFCLNSWVGDGYCDYDCNNKECNFDKGDCDQIKTENPEMSFTYEAALTTPKKIPTNEGRIY